MAERLVVEYAKSSRAACKLCDENVAKGSVRIGTVGKGRGGIDMTRWHHPECFMKKSFKGDVNSLNEITGFDLLKAGEQEELKKLAADSEIACKEGDPKRQKIDEKGAVEQRELKKQAADLMKQAADLKKQAADLKNACTEGAPKTIKKEEKRDGISEGEPKLDMDFNPSQLTTKYKGADLPEGWIAFSTVIINGLKTDITLCKEKIAAFDFDGCLANTSVQRHGADAWSLLYPSIPKKMQDYHKDGYKLVIFTNESNIDRWKNNRQKAIDSKIGRLEAFMKVVGAPIQIFISCGKETNDLYRKPNHGMWLLLERHFNSGVPIDKTRSFFVGDAAGRRSDHSDADLAFAKAIGVKFHLPEDIF